MPSARAVIGTRTKVAGVLLLALGVGYLLYLGRDRGWLPEPEPPARSDKPPPLAFAGESSLLKQTVILPTLDTPLPANKSAVWCASFQLAWNAFKDSVTHGPVQIQGAPIEVHRLNAARESADDLAPGSYYAAAGLIRAGIVDTIRHEMAQRFPHVTPATQELPDSAALAYAYLEAGVRYKHEFFDNPERFLFTDSSGTQTPVASFGISDRERAKDGAGISFRGQVAVLWRSADKREFAVDLCRDSTPNQVVLSRMSPGATLGETVASLRRIIGDGQAVNRNTESLGDEDTLLVPVMHWDIEHRFRELEGPDKALLNPGLQGLYLGLAMQRTRFKLDRKGAEVASEAMLEFLDGGPKRYHFDGPFLLYLQKRGAKEPFLVLWVDNPELMVKP